jgi:hypothetical protein
MGVLNMETISKLFNSLLSGIQQFISFFVDLPNMLSQFLGGILPAELISILLIALGITILIRIVELLT